MCLIKQDGNRTGAPKKLVPAPEACLEETLISAVGSQVEEREEGAHFHQGGDTKSGDYNAGQTEFGALTDSSCRVSISHQNIGRKQPKSP